jgi:hypothetical protein
MGNENVVQENWGLQNEIEEKSPQIHNDMAESERSGLRKKAEIGEEIEGFGKQGIWHSQNENDEVVRNPQGQDGEIGWVDWSCGEWGLATGRSGRRKPRGKRKPPGKRNRR